MLSKIRRPAGSHFQAGGDERVSDRVSDMGMSGARYFSKNHRRGEAVSNKPYFRAGNFQINPIFVRAVFKSTLLSCRHFSSGPYICAGTFQVNPISMQAVFKSTLFSCGQLSSQPDFRAGTDQDLSFCVRAPIKICFVFVSFGMAF